MFSKRVCQIPGIKFDLPQTPTAQKQKIAVDINKNKLEFVRVKSKKGNIEKGIIL
jgi:hypothetical protein